MTKNISFQIENTIFQGKLIYGNGNENETNYFYKKYDVLSKTIKKCE